MKIWLLLTTFLGVFVAILSAAGSQNHENMPGPAHSLATGGPINVRDFGAKGDGRYDDTKAIQAAIDYVPKGRMKIVIPAGVYLVTDTLRITQDRVHIEGFGKQTTIIKFMPTTTKTAMLFSSGSDRMLVQDSLKGLAFSSDRTNIIHKVAVQMTHVSEMQIEDVAVYPWTGNDSIGFQFQGKELIRVSSVMIAADQPIDIKRDPYVSIPGTPINGVKQLQIDIDQTHFQDLYLIASLTQPVIRIADGVNLTNVTFDGYQSWCRGSYGLYWNDMSTTQVGYALSISNVRWEQYNNPDGYMIYINNHHGFQNLTLNNLRAVALDRGKGIYLHNISGVTLENFTYWGGNIEALNFSSLDGIHIAATRIDPNSKILMNHIKQITGSYSHGPKFVTYSGGLPSPPQTR